MHIPFLHLNNKSPLEQTIAEGNQPVSRNFFSKKNIIIFAIAAFAILNIVLFFVTGVVPTENLPFLQKPSPTPVPDVLLAIVGKKKIYRSTVEKTALQTFLPNAITKKALQDTYSIVIERAILDYEAKKLNIEVNGPKNTANYYSLLKQKIIEKEVNSRNAFIMGYWIPPKSFTDKDKLKAKYDSYRSNGNIALNEIETKLNNGEKPSEIIKEIYDQYPVIQNILAYNAYIYKTLKDKSSLDTPRTYTYSANQGKNSLFEALFSMSPNEVRKVLNEDGSGGSVIKLISINKSDISSYNIWLEKMKKELVKTYQKI